MKIIPAIDLKDGACVRLMHGDFDQVTHYSNEPSAVAMRFQEIGFDYLHLVDLDGALAGSSRNAQSIADIIASTTMAVQVGGGIRDEMGLRHWFDAGVRRCVVGSIAMSNPDIVKAWLRQFSSDQIVLALDVRLTEAGVPLLTMQGWTENSALSLWDCLDGYADIGLTHVLCTDVGRDGALTGPNLDLYSRILRRYPALQLQASGGVRNIDDLRLAAEVGVAATITGRALLDGRISKQEIDSFLQNA